MEREISVGWRRIVATYLHISKLISVVIPSRLIARLGRICNKYCGIRRYRLSLVSLQIADWPSAGIFENSV